jgi:hypothetical protein
MLGLRRVVFVLQWVAPFVIPVYTVVIAAKGWTALLIVPMSFLAFLAMLANAIIATASKDLRGTRAVPPAYAVLSVLLWFVMLVFPLTASPSGGTAPGPSDLAGIGLDIYVTGALFEIFFVLGLGLWIASFTALLRRDRLPSSPVRSNGLPAAE